MNKHKKLLALICAISMMMSMFVGMTVVRADDKGMTLKVVTNESKKKVIEVDYAGYGEINSAGVELTLPADFASKLSAAEVVTGFAGVSATVRQLAEIKSTNVFLATFSSSTNLAYTDGKLMTITFTLSEDYTDEFNVDFVKGSSAQSGIEPTGKGDLDYLADGDLTATGVAVPEYVDPNKTPEPATPTPAVPIATRAPRVTKAPATTEPGEATAKPTREPVVLTNKNMTLKVVTDEAKKKVIEVDYAGYDEINSAGVELTLPADFVSKLTAAEVVTGFAGVSATVRQLAEIKSTNVFLATFSSSTNLAYTDGKLMTITFTLSEDYNDEFDIDFVTGSSAQSGIEPTGKGDLDYLADGDISVDGVRVPEVGGETPVETDKPESTPEPVVGTPIPAESKTTGDGGIVEKSKVDAVNEKVTDGVSNLRLAVKVTKPDEKTGEQVDAKYGEDFVAAVPDSSAEDGYRNLTEEEFDAIVNGYPTDAGFASVQDALSKMVFKPYNNSMKFTVQAIDATDPANEVVVAEGEGESKSDDGGKTDDNKNDPSWSVKASKSTIDGGDSATITATLTKNAYKNGKIRVSIDADSLDAVSAAGVTVVAKDTATDASTGKTTDKEYVLSGATKSVEITDEVGNDKVVVTASFKGVSGKKNQDVNITFSYVDYNGTATKDDVGKVTVKKTSSDNKGGGGSSSSSSSSGGNVIAAGNQTVNGVGIYPDVTFTDLGNVDWAVEAITTLAHNGVISGRDAYTFDPDANITRAEYCQILINAIGKQNNYADTSFNDVPTDAWFYHNVAVASQLGIVSGYGDGNFGPYDLITREQMALMTQKAAQVIGKSLAAKQAITFSDDAAIADWSKAAVYDLANAGVINGMGDGTFAPKNNATRAQAAVIIYQIVK